MDTILITGAAGFIGNRAGEFFKENGFYCIGIDNCSRPISRINREYWHEFYQIDCGAINCIDLPRVDIILHLAAKTSVTRSITSPFADFDTNVRQSFELVQWAKSNRVKKILYSSTNKVYGELEGRRVPIGIETNIDPVTPYGIGKAVIGTYIKEFFPTNGYVFNQSCIWGETQIGSLDQGWVSFLAKEIVAGRPITCFGDGNQIRDLLHIDDLLRAYLLAINNEISPGLHPIGGGISNSISFRDAVNLLGGKISKYEPKRKMDQDYFISANDSLPREWKENLISVRDIKKLVGGDI